MTIIADPVDKIVWLFNSLLDFVDSPVPYLWVQHKDFCVSSYINSGGHEDLHNKSFMAPMMHVGQTTAVGEPKPGPLGRVAFPPRGQPVTLGKAMVSMAAMGLGMGLMFGLIGKLM